MVSTKRKHNAEAAGGPERHEQIDKRSTLFFAGFGQKLLELIDNQQSFRVADRQIAADRVARLARICRIDAPAQGRALVRGSPSRSAASVMPRFSASTGSRRGRMTTTCHRRRSGSRPAVSASAPPRKTGIKSSLSKRGLARATVRHHRDQPMPLQLGDKLDDLIVATKEPIRIRFGHRFETDKRTIHRDRLLASRSVQHSAQKLRKLLCIVEGVCTA